MNYYTLGEAARLLGRSYSQCWHVFAYGRLRWPRRVGRSFILDNDDLAALTAYFNGDGDREGREPVAPSEQSSSVE
jgi:hypothetical protein